MGSSCNPSASPRGAPSAIVDECFVVIRAPVQLIAKTDLGSLEGIEEGGVAVFKGIPYAAPPLGVLRWREPQPLQPWTGVRAAHMFGPASIQPEGQPLEGGATAGPQSEDCLYLNVWTPGAEPSAKRPVMVWIHGGAFTKGAGSLPIYSGVPLARKGTVVVTFNYRLGHLGFFAHPALEKARPGGPMNFGLLDQIALLEWVRQHIVAFGGDAGNVTIFGESAGGQSVLALFASPLARGLFHRGIVQSSPAFPEAPRAEALRAGGKLASAVGLNGADATLEELCALPAATFGPMKRFELSLAPVLLSGDAALPQPIGSTFGAGQEAPLPLIIGSNSDEATVIAASGIDPASVIRRLGTARVVVDALYPGTHSDRRLGCDVLRDIAFTMPARWIADQHAKLAPTWRYYFSYVGAATRGPARGGVPHGDEIPYTLDTGDAYAGTPAEFAAADREMARCISGYWLEFARTGVPSSHGCPEWPNHDAEHDRAIEFGDAIAVQENFMKRRMDVFIGFMGRLAEIWKAAGISDSTSTRA